MLGGVRYSAALCVRRLRTIKRHLASQHIFPKMTSRSPTVGIIIIGDEILKGHTHDTNSNFLCKRLFSLGVKVKRVSVIPDDLDVIAEEVSSFSQKYTHVITAGGIGPTHDDLTFEGVAKAFGEGVHAHPKLVEICKKFFGTDDLKSPKLKLAFIPESAKLNYGINKETGEKNIYPVVSIRNVYIFPGVPRLMERAFDMLEEMFRNPDSSLHVCEIYLITDEVSIAGVLNDVDAKFKDNVILGSYPEFYNSYYKVKLTLESENKAKLEEACAYLKTQLPPDAIVHYEKDPISKAAEYVYQLAESTEDSSLVRGVWHAVQVIEECFDRYGFEEICVGFNGGKDCTVLLHLVHAVCMKKYPGESKKLQALYIRRGLPFPEVELFIKKSVESYRLDLVSISGRIKEAMGDLKQQRRNIQAVLMGTRRSDPYSGHLSSFSMTDPDWPQFMRASPILDWSYSDVWLFLRRLCLPYCPLYDRGYTSLGSMENTHPNPSLQSVNAKGIVTYRPAYELVNDASEREGRN